MRLDAPVAGFGPSRHEPRCGNTAVASWGSRPSRDGLRGTNRAPRRSRRVQRPSGRRRNFGSGSFGGDDVSLARGQSPLQLAGERDWSHESHTTFGWVAVRLAQ